MIKLTVVYFIAAWVYLEGYLLLINGNFLEELTADEKRPVVMMTATAAAVVCSYAFSNLFDFFGDVDLDGENEEDEAGEEKQPPQLMPSGAGVA